MIEREPAGMTELTCRPADLASSPSWSRGALPAAAVAEHAQVSFGVRCAALGIADMVHDEHLSRLRGCIGAPLQDA
jgi:hypothetical protein